MGDIFTYFSWTCRPAWPLFIILMMIPCMLYCSESPPAPAGKMYPRGNHWAVGHLMGKKSLPVLQETNSDFLVPSENFADLDRYQGVLQALMRQKNAQKMRSESADRLLGLRSGWGEEDRDKYLREVSVWLVSSPLTFSTNYSSANKICISAL
uniref:Gastrin-releasing peptide n=1 Tax=Mola mola TaxID=94237 RepID=A0A3Q3VMK9_MOLML